MSSSLPLPRQLTKPTERCLFRSFISISKLNALPKLIASEEKMKRKEKIK